ncbi:MAG: serpin family protein [Capsulimonas sp.]|uniref:serpin family protein n=1 Tax=Capsulimonas sp. TaxID=2494211 RepID=UPI0032665767
MKKRHWRQSRAAWIVGFGALAAAGCQPQPHISSQPHIDPTHSELDAAPRHIPPPNLKRNISLPDLNTVAADKRVQEIAKANADFGWRLLKPLAKEAPNANVFYSPFSVTQALSMTMNGAGGDTQTAMMKTLGLKDVKIGDVNAANRSLLPSLTGVDPQIKINVANAVWVDKHTTLKPLFQQTCLASYQGRAVSLDLASSDGAQRINSWVSEQTKGEIHGIVAPSDLDDARLVLTNAVYFHGMWMHEFDKSETQNGRFHLSKGREKTLPLMSDDITVDYRETDQFQAASLPYGDGRFRLDIVLPKRVDGLDAVVKSLDAKRWSNLTSRMNPQNISVTLPRFQVSYAADLTDPLTSLGMGSAFHAGADFTPMCLEPVHIDKVMHKAILQVDEEGTTAAAVTAAPMAGGVSADPAIVFRVDHPFVCAIRDNTTGTLLFVGVIRDPEKL